MNVVREISLIFLNPEKFNEKINFSMLLLCYFPFARGVGVNDVFCCCNNNFRSAAGNTIMKQGT